MIIVSQDGKTIVNFENITVIGTCVPEKEQIGSITTNGDNQVLGLYKTEERAKEVLIEIMQSYIDSENYKYLNQLMNANDLNRLQKGLVYEMPEE